MWIHKNFSNQQLINHYTFFYQEIMGVIWLGLGYFIASAIGYRILSITPTLNDSNLWSTLLIEAVLGICILSSLFKQQYSCLIGKNMCTLYDIGWVIGQLILLFLGIHVINNGYLALNLHHATNIVYTHQASILTILIFSFCNACYEESILLGYLLHRLCTKNIGIAILVSLLIRLSYHIHYDFLGLIHIALFGLVVSFNYLCLGRIAPAVLTHALYDVIALSNL
ncbi:MAG: CPBP family intramembrane metalloprotease [Neisseriales bacterium]|nr:MAG: CPBP family intramembrane metalloprotease [Neisseriales bacterium]